MSLTSCFSLENSNNSWDHDQPSCNNYKSFCHLSPSPDLHRVFFFFHWHRFNFSRLWVCRRDSAPCYIFLHGSQNLGRIDSSALKKWYKYESGRAILTTMGRILSTERGNRGVIRGVSFSAFSSNQLSSSRMSLLSSLNTTDFSSHIIRVPAVFLSCTVWRAFHMPQGSPQYCWRIHRFDWVTYWRKRAHIFTLSVVKWAGGGTGVVRMT